MRVAVLGASGRTGKEFINQAIHKGIELRALVRSPEKILIAGNIQIIKGDATDRSSIEQLLDGCDTVVSLLGHTKGSVSSMQAQALKHVIDVMQTKGISRLIDLTGANVYFPSDKISLIDRCSTLLLKLFAPSRYADGVIHCSLIRQSNLEWTIVRAFLLTNGKLTRHYKSGNLKIGLLSCISRADVAHYIIGLLEHGGMIKQAPRISY